MPLLNFSSNFKEILYELSLLSVCLISTVCKILKFQPYTSTNIASSLKKSIYCLFNNRTKDFCQNFEVYIFGLKKHPEFNFKTKIAGIGLKFSDIYHFKAENAKFYESNFEPLLSTFSIGLFSLIVCPHIAP